MGSQDMVPFGDVKTLANSLKLLLSHEGQRVKMGQEGRRVVEQCFTQERQTRRVEEIYVHSEI